MKKKTIRDVSCTGKRALVRVDFNVPIANGSIEDDTRIVASLPTIRHILDDGGTPVLMSHLGRPKGEGYEAQYSLAPVAGHLSRLLDREVLFLPDCIGAATESAVASAPPGTVILLENLRFHPEEEGKVASTETDSPEEKRAKKEQAKIKQREFAKCLSALGDLYVNDAFGTAHRAHASTAVVNQFFTECVAGLLMEKELEYLGNTLENPSRPFVAILGGAKVSDKVGVIDALINKVNCLLIGGAMAYTFLASEGVSVGRSLVEPDKIDLARSLRDKAASRGVTMLLPIDHVVAEEFSANAPHRVVPRDGIPTGGMALDIGPETRAAFADAVKVAKTIVWNGPMGCFEMEPFAAGTLAIAKAVAESGAVSIVGGGDSVSAINRSGFASAITHISTGGGASLEFLEGKELPGVVALSDK